MNDLTRLNGHRLLLNCDLIKLVEPTPDTTITLITGEKVNVLESCDELLQAVTTFRSDVLRQAFPEALCAMSAVSAHRILTK